MLETMYVRCAQCGYDNSPEYRFCGMCGASLAHPSVASQQVALPQNPVPTRAETEPTETVHGPSFLGLSEDPKVEFHYLYEDEEPKSHVGLVLFLLILLGGGGLLVWQWRNNGYPFNRVSSANATPPSAAPSEVAPAQNQDQQTHTEKPKTGAGDQPPAAPEQKKQPEAKDKASEPTGDENANPAGKSEATDSKSNHQTVSAEEKTAENPDEEAKATTPPRVPEKPARRPTPQPRAPNPKAATPPAAPATSITEPDSDLEVVGERYLYGKGLPQNCGRAESSLRTAATRGNAKAQTALGTMYATGHCVGRDLPTAYRWFARALQQEPQNSRIAYDLQVLWRQMTPQERQLAVPPHK